MDGLSYWGRQITQRTFEFNGYEHEDNIQYLAEEGGWLDQIEEFRINEGVPATHLRYNGVPQGEVLDLIDNWTFVESPTTQTRKHLIMNYIRRMNAVDELTHWTVYFPSRAHDLQVELETMLLKISSSILETTGLFVHLPVLWKLMTDFDK